MREELNIRIWDIQEQEWYAPVYEAWQGKLHDLLLSPSGDLLLHTMSGLAHESTFPDRYVVQRFAGFRDKAGKRIFEHDICRVSGGWSGDCIQPMYSLSNFHFWDEVRQNLDAGASYEVLGNDFENPELITEAA